MKYCIQFQSGNYPVVPAYLYHEGWREGTYLITSIITDARMYSTYAEAEREALQFVAYFNEEFSILGEDGVRYAIVDNHGVFRKKTIPENIFTADWD